jgi:hypothetical protein
MARKKVPARMASFLPQAQRARRRGHEGRRLQGTHPLHPPAASEHHRRQPRGEITRAFGGLQDERVEQLRKRRIHVPDMETLKRLWVDEDRD